MMTQTLTPTLLNSVSGINQRLTTNTARSADHAYFQQLAEHSPDLIYRYEFTPKRGFAYVSPAATVMVGYTPDEHYADPDLGFKLVHPEDRHILEAMTHGKIASGQPAVLRWVHKDGSVVWIEQRNVGIFDESGELVAIEGIARDITARKRLTQRNASLIAALGQIVYEWYPSTDELLWEGDYTRILGYSSAEMGTTTASWTCRIHPDDLQRALGEVDSAAKTDRMYELEYRFLQRDGNYRWMQDKGIIFLNPNGEVERIIGIFSDISTRKQAEEQAHRRVSELEALYQSGIAFSQTFDQKEIAEKVIEVLVGRLKWHHAAVRIRRGQGQEVELLGFSQADGRKYEAQVRSAITRVGQGMSGWVIENGKPLCSADLSSDPRYVVTVPGMKSGLYVPIRMYDRTIGCISIESEQENAFTEADERLLSTLAVQAAVAFENARLYESAVFSAQRLAVLYEAGQQLVRVRQDMEELYAAVHHSVEQLMPAEAFTIVLHNEAHKDLEAVYLFDKGGRCVPKRFPFGSGFSSQVIASGKTILIRDLVTTPVEAVHFGTNDPIRSVLAVPLRSGDRVFGVISTQSYKPDAYKDEDHFLLELLAAQAAVVFENAQLFLASQHELAERKVAEEKLRQLNTDLEQRVALRTADLSRVNTELEQALRVKDEFLANMSHELRTPLNAVIGLSESLIEQTAGTLNEKQAKYVNTISESGRHLLALINDILELAKIEAGKVTLNQSPVNVKQVCQSSLRLVAELAYKKNQTIQFSMDQHLDLIWADERRLKQMLVNLLSNAIKFTPEHGHIGLEVHADRENERVNFTVWDTGIGIKEGDRARLFRPFVQLDADLAREYNGTGLGLALVAEMARLHGGSVTVESTPGEGSRFTITLPLKALIGASPVSKNTGSLQSVRLGQRTHEHSILLIEDTTEVIMVIRDYLEFHGYHVTVARSGVEGIEAAQRLNPDLILMDVQMPGMDGLETTRRLRQLPNFRHTPIIAVTARAMPDDRQICLAAGMDEYITKPVNLKSMVKLIQKLLLAKP